MLVDLDTGECREDIQFGNFVTGSIHGFKFEDKNANGIQDGDDVALADAGVCAETTLSCVPLPTPMDRDSDDDSSGGRRRRRDSDDDSSENFEHAFAPRFAPQRRRGCGCVGATPPPRARNLFMRRTQTL